MVNLALNHLKRLQNGNPLRRGSEKAIRWNWGKAKSGIWCAAAGRYSRVLGPLLLICHLHVHFQHLKHCNIIRAKCETRDCAFVQNVFHFRR